MTYSVVPTTDGSNTLFTSQFNASYHSVHGALEESKVVFIQLGLQYLAEKGYQHIRLFEMGFGTGLNAALSLQYAGQHGLTIQYTGVEAFPVPIEIIQQTNLSALFAAPFDEVFMDLHRLPWNQNHQLRQGSIFTKWHTVLEDFESENKFDLIYFDAFAPECQPELWSEEILQKMYDLLDRNGVLTTYCAKGIFKRTLKKVGFHLENHPGPGRKREITRAIKL